MDHQAHRNAKYSSRLSADTLAIFLFHGVIEKQTYAVRNYIHKHLEADYFATVLDDLNEHGVPLSMQDIVELQTAGKPYPPNAFAITFDDGFENNFSIAAPILADKKIPATFYVTTGFIEENSLSWIDRIELCLEESDRVTIAFPWLPASHTVATAAEKIELLNEVRKYVKADLSIDTEQVVQSVFEQCGQNPITSSDDPLDKKMSWQQVSTLGREPGFIVGGHTHKHAMLAFLSPEKLSEEISTSMTLLKERAGLSPRHYSYPEGQAQHFNDGVIAELKRQGIICSPTAIDGVNQSEDLFHLRRIMVV